jgi:hypothetical protein
VYRKLFTSLKEKMKLLDSRVYWIGQFSWWIFTTFVLRQPNSKYFEQGYNLPIYLVISFFIGLVLTHIYKEIFNKKLADKRNVIPYALLGIVIVGGAFIYKTLLLVFSDIENQVWVCRLSFTIIYSFT